MSAPVADLAGVVPILAALAARGLRIAGGVLAVAGIGLTVRAQLDMGASWRIGVHVGGAAPLVTCGVFEHVRNPIFTAVLLAFGGLSLLVPNVLSLAGWATLLAGLEVQVRRVEEPHLAAVHGERYHEYAARVGRFLPRLGRMDRKGGSDSSTRQAHPRGRI